MRMNGLRKGMRAAWNRDSIMSQCDGRRGHAHEQPLLDRGHVPQHAALHVRQDFFFARECTRFIALNVANAPFKLFPTLLGGLTAIDDELQWFQPPNRWTPKAARRCRPM